MANKLLNKIKASLVKTAGSDTESFEEEKHHETQVTDILLVIRREKQIRINKKSTLNLSKNINRIYIV